MGGLRGLRLRGGASGFVLIVLDDWRQCDAILPTLLRLVEGSIRGRVQPVGTELMHGARIGDPD